MIKETATKTKMALTYQEIREKCIKYFGGDELAASTWMNKYALRDKDGNLQETTPDDMHRRMAHEFARKEKEYTDISTMNGKADLLSEYGQKRELLTEEKIFELFKGFKYVIPQGSVMFGLGNKYVTASLSNCVVLPEIYDSYGGIMHTDQQ